MKTSLILVGLCVFLVSMPIGLSDCGCTLPDDTSTSQSSEQPWLTDADISALKEQGIKEGWTFTVDKNPATQQPLSQLCGFVVPDNWWVGADFDPCTPTRDLPTSFDWRTLGGCTPIRDQGGCGSCWAFGTVAPLECNILIKDKKEVDLSEQWLVSCNKNGWGCNGGWWAHDYHQWKMDRFNDTGAVLEEDFPYTAYDEPCNGPYPHPYLIDSWRFIGMPQGIPKPDQIKQAILDHGPVSVSCAVTQAFGAYSGGIFNEDDPDAQINHAVALVGWDDTQGTNGVWILRNSWGSWWGEDGYMRIEYGVCKVGFAACYVNYPVKTEVKINGGLFGPIVELRNIGDITSTNLKWKTSLKGGVLNGIDETFETTITSLEPGKVIFERFPRFGFGPLSISVTVTPKNVGKRAKQVEGVLWGLLLILPQNQ